MPEVVCDLPAGAKRLQQKCDGMHATIVNGYARKFVNSSSGPRASCARKLMSALEAHGPEESLTSLRRTIIYAAARWFAG